MALKAKLTKAEYDALNETVRKEYIDNGDGEYTLDVDGIEDAGALKRALQREKSEAKDKAKKLAEAEEALAAERAKHAPKDGDKTPKQIENEWKTKYDTDLSKSQKQLAATQEFLRQEVASGLAKELFTVPNIGKKYLIDRIAVSLDEDGKPVTKFLHEDGHEDDALTVDVFKKEIRANKELATILIGSKASGGGATGDKGGSGGGATQPKAFKDMNDAERTALYKTDPAEFDRQSALHTPARRIV